MKGTGFAARATKFSVGLYSSMPLCECEMRFLSPFIFSHERVGGCEKDSEAVLGVWLPAPLPTPRALSDHDALWPLAVGVEKDLGGIDV